MIGQRQGCLSIRLASHRPRATASPETLRATSGSPQLPAALPRLGAPPRATSGSTPSSPTCTRRPQHCRLLGGFGETFGEPGLGGGGPVVPGLDPAVGPGLWRLMGRTESLLHRVPGKRVHLCPHCRKHRWACVGADRGPAWVRMYPQPRQMPIRANIPLLESLRLRSAVLGNCLVSPAAQSSTSAYRSARVCQPVLAQIGQAGLPSVTISSLVPSVGEAMAGTGRLWRPSHWDTN